MIVFNYNLVFKDEPKPQNNIFKNDLESIFIMEEQTFSLSDTFSLIGTWIPIASGKIRYLSTILFEKANTKFSWALEIKDVVTLIWNEKDRTILYIKRNKYTPEQLRYWIFHSFFPTVIELERTYRILHVGSVEIAGKPVAFSAHSYGGKSTLTDYFLKQGHTLLSDDSLGIEKRDDGYYAISSYPFHRPFREIETLGYYTENFNTEPKPLHAVYALQKAEADAEVSIEELKGIEKFKAFHYSNFIDFDFMKKERFIFFTEMAKAIPVYRINIPWDKERLEEVYQAIISHTL
jgi:hypothetical protein